MSRKSWASAKALEWAGATIPRLMGRRGMLESAIRETIRECARRCATHHSVEGIAQRCERDILALLEPGGEK